jgi:hypothetical protein
LLLWHLKRIFYICVSIQTKVVCVRLKNIFLSLRIRLFTYAAANFCELISHLHESHMKSLSLRLALRRLFLTYVWSPGTRPVQLCTNNRLLVGTPIWFRNRSRDSDWLDGQGVGVWDRVEAKYFSSPSGPDRCWGPSSLPYNGYNGLYPRGKIGRDVKPTISAKVKNTWICTSTSSLCNAWLVK